MAAARPLPDERDQQVAAEVVWRLVVDAQRDDLGLVLRRWPDRTSREVVAAVERIRCRGSTGGDVDRAAEAIRASYGGARRVPAAVRERMEAYIQEQLEHGWEAQP